MDTMVDRALQNAIVWNLRRRDDAKRKGDRPAVNHFQHNVDQLRERSRVMATGADQARLADSALSKVIEWDGEK